MLKQRIITAVILGSVIISAVLYMTTPMFGFMLAMIIGVAAWEWATCVGLHSMLQKIIYTLFILFCFMGCLKFLEEQWWLFIIICGLIWWFIATFLVVRYQINKNISLSSCFLKSMIGVVILVPACLSLILIHAKSNGVSLVLFLFFLIWLVDSAAYFSGKKFAHKKLASNVSSGKSWEGVYGALIMSVLFGIGYALYTGMQFSTTIYFILLVLFTVSFSILGDLVESMFKRMAGVKDSSRILPGHGGVLDRIDSLTSAAPVFLAGIWIMEPTI